MVTAAVVDDAGVLLGQITIDDVVDVIQELADHDILSRAGLDEDDDMFAPVVSSSRRRAVWLGANLATGFLAAAVVRRISTNYRESGGTCRADAGRLPAWVVSQEARR